MQQVQRFRQQLLQGVLPVLRGAAYRVEETEVLRQLRGTVTLFHGVSEPPLHVLGFAAQHRGLVGHANGLQMHIRVKARRISAAEFLEKLLFVAAVHDVIADVIGFGQREHHQVMTAAMRAWPANWWLWFPRARPCRE